MKDSFLKELDNALDIYEIENKEEILEKYRKRYDFGLESGLSANKIEEMLGNPLDIARSLKHPDDEEACDSGETKSLKNYNLIVKTVADKIIVKYTDEPLVRTVFEGIELDCYDVTNSKVNGVLINFHKRKYFSLNRRKAGSIIVEVPRDRVFDKIVLQTNSSTIESCNLKANSIEISIVAKKANIGDLSAKQVNLQTVSGDIKCGNVICEDCGINSVSGDMDIKSVISNQIRVDTVSGDIKITESSGVLSVSSITGDVLINGVNSKNLRDKIRGIFK